MIGIAHRTIALNLWISFHVTVFILLLLVKGIKGTTRIFLRGNQLGGLMTIIFP